MEAAGLALWTLAIVSLFKSCVDNFDIVVKAKDFSEEFDLLCAKVPIAHPAPTSMLPLTCCSSHYSRCGL